ncbi:MAG: exosortase A [Novosphingobium sp.]
MQPEAPARVAAGTGWHGWPAPWRAALPGVAAVWLALIVLFRADWAAMADQWWNSSTYTHILVVPGIVAWLVWARAPQLALLAPRPWWPGLVPFAGAAFLWLLGDLAGFSLASQAGAVAMLALAVPVLLGPKVAAALVFPLAYMAFLVPFGDELVPPLQMITAKLTTSLVSISGIPARIDGVFIETPAGLFEVAEACSGAKFLIAMIAFGVLVTNVCFRSWPRRFGFLALAVVLPILANGVRAWGTIFVAQYVGAEKATGFDHLVYGWVFFAVVMALSLALAWRFFDRAADDAMIDGAAIRSSELLTALELHAVRPPTALIAMTVPAVLAVGWAGAADRLHAPLPQQIALPEVPGWSRVGYAPKVWWEPRARGADHRLLGRYRDAQGREVDVFFALYASQDEGKEAGGFGEGALTPGTSWAWLSPGPDFAEAKSDRLLGAGRHGRLAETTYRSGDVVTGSNLRLKLANISDRLRLKARPTALLILSSEEPHAETSLRAFRRSVGPLGEWMDRVGGLR